jgi:hypothetical protein
VDPQKAFTAVDHSMRNFEQKHEQKLATCGWMLSEWFEDFWIVGDTYTRIEQRSIPKDASSHPRL